MVLKNINQNNFFNLLYALEPLAWNTSNLSLFLTKSACFKTLKNVSLEASTACSDLVDDGDNDHLTPPKKK
jgi:hypothetical protein